MALALRRSLGRLPAIGLLVMGSLGAVSAARPAHAAIGTISLGSSGSDVRIWQRDLNAFMYGQQTCRPTLTVDGDFGQQTHNATTCFQRLGVV